jgi:hypothetical protein
MLYWVVRFVTDVLNLDLTHSDTWRVESAVQADYKLLVTRRRPLGRRRSPQWPGCSRRNMWFITIMTYCTWWHTAVCHRVMCQCYHTIASNDVVLRFMDRKPREKGQHFSMQNTQKSDISYYNILYVDRKQIYLARFPYSPWETTLLRREL